MVWWEVILVVSATTTLVANGLIQEQRLSNTDLLQDQDELDTELLQEQHYLEIDLQQDGFDAAGNLVNNTGILGDYGMEIASDQVETMTERGKKCFPTVSCDRAGGFCVKKRCDCKGTIDPFGCRGSKKCKCCIPDDIICGPASTTVAPTTTTGMASTTVAPTTTTDPTVTWLSACSDRFLRIEQKMNWNDAQTLCMSYGLDLYQPKDCYCVAKYLEERFNERYSWHWLGARANGTEMIWLSGDVLATDDACWYDNPNGYHLHRGSNACLWMVSNSGWVGSGKGVYNTQNDSCQRTSFDVLCG